MLFENKSNNIAVIEDNGEIFTYNQLYKCGEMIISHIKERCLIIILCENKSEIIALYTASIRNHIIPLLLQKEVKETILNNMIEQYKPQYIFGKIKKLNNINNIKLVFQIREYGLFMCSEKKIYDIYRHLALLLTTSGSTGDYKCVRISYKNLISNTEEIISYLKIKESCKTITTLPMNYAYGLSIINSYLQAGAQILLTDLSIIKPSFWEAFKINKCNSISGVPYTYEIMDRLGFFEKKSEYLDTLTQAGGALPNKLNKKIVEYSKKNKIVFFSMYGQTEATARISYLESRYNESKMGSIGKPLNCGKLYLVNSEDGEIIKKDKEIGELVYEGPNVALGYAYSYKDLSNADKWNGILYTGDLAYYDSDGFFYICGRKNRYTKLFGLRIFLDDLDKKCCEYFNGIKVVSVGKKNHLYIFYDKQLCLDELNDFIISNTQLKKYMFELKKIDEIPTNNNGKVNYMELERLAENE